MNRKVECNLCPKRCLLSSGETGNCGVRKNSNGKIVCITYGNPCAVQLDPIEKKPLYHFLPSSSVLSIGTAGCNLHCRHCQNWEISQAGLHDSTKQPVTPEDIVQTAKQHQCPAIAYTYTEPLVSYEYTLDCCMAAASEGVRNVLVTAAYINPGPLTKLCQYVDAANVDLKSFTESFYKEICDAHLAPVLNALKIMKESGVMLELTHLMIPTLNDTEEETKLLCDWVLEHLGPDVPIHFSRFIPHYRLNHLPQTPVEKILRAREIAHQAGLRFVYVGNLSDRAGECTWCPECGTLLIERTGYHVLQNRIKKGCCPACNTCIPGIWN